jgi:hypothetical protein
LGVLRIYPVVGVLKLVTGHNLQGRQIELTYNQVPFLITSPLHRQKGLFMDENWIVCSTFKKVLGYEK